MYQCLSFDWIKTIIIIIMLISPNGCHCEGDMAWVGVCVSLALSLSCWKIYIFKPALPPYVMLLDNTIIKNLGPFQPFFSIRTFKKDLVKYLFIFGFGVPYLQLIALYKTWLILVIMGPHLWKERIKAQNNKNMIIH